MRYNRPWRVDSNGNTIYQAESGGRTTQSSCTHSDSTSRPGPGSRAGFTPHYSQIQILISSLTRYYALSSTASAAFYYVEIKAKHQSASASLRIRFVPVFRNYIRSLTIFESRFQRMNLSSGICLLSLRFPAQCN
jgi:hypothetical protein